MGSLVHIPSRRIVDHNLRPPCAMFASGTHGGRNLVLWPQGSPPHGHLSHVTAPSHRIGEGNPHWHLIRLTAPDMRISVPVWSLRVVLLLLCILTSCIGVPALPMTLVHLTDKPLKLVVRSSFLRGGRQVALQCGPGPEPRLRHFVCPWI